MESLALLVVLIFCSVILCGPAAVFLAHSRWPVLALILGAFAIFLGIHWFATVSTTIKYLGVVSAGLGLWALLKVTGDMLP